MKTQNITGEGHIGLSITLNVLDQHAVNELVDRIDAYFAAENVRNAWDKAYYDDNKRYTVDPETGEKITNWNSWMEYKKLYPEPQRVQLDLREEVKTMLNFLRKLRIDSDNKADIFD